MTRWLIALALVTVSCGRTDDDAAQRAPAPATAPGAASTPGPAGARMPPLPADPLLAVLSPLAGTEVVGSARCMPCHADAHGSWNASQHAHSIRVISMDEEDLLATLVPCSDMTATHVLGERHDVRFLVERPDVAWGDGRWLALPCSWKPKEKAPDIKHLEDWRERPVESACAACHVTGFRRDHSFVEPGVGCESCHGPGGQHVLAPSRANIVAFGGAARDEVTVCASCHLQDGVSRRTGLKFPDGYIPGGSLLDDFTFDWDSLASADLTRALDVHQKILVRRVLLDGDDSLRCTSCHQMHAMGHEKHRSLPVQEACSTCHQPDMKLKEYSQSCNVCEF